MLQGGFGDILTPIMQAARDPQSSTPFIKIRILTLSEQCGNEIRVALTILVNYMSKKYYLNEIKEEFVDISEENCVLRISKSRT